MKSMFRDTRAFNRGLNAWRTSRVTTAESMFKNAVAFNQSIGAWQTTSMTSMDNMFHGAEAFREQDIRGWDVCSVQGCSSTDPIPCGFKRFTRFTASGGKQA